MRISFYVRTDTDQDRQAAIIATVCFDGKRLRLASGVSVLPKQWDRKRQKVKRGATGEATINRQVESFAALVLSAYNQLRNEGKEPTAELIKDRLRQQEQEDRPWPTVYAAYKEYIADSETRLRPATLAIHRTTKSHVEAFEKKMGIAVTWESLNLLFFQKFAEYLIRVAGMNNETLDKVIRTLRAFLRHAAEVKEIPMCEDFRKFTRKSLPKGQKSRKVYLTTAELRKLQELELSGNDRLRRVRDLFLFLAHTGLRYNDAQQLRPEHRRGTRFELVTGKNRKVVHIPVHPVAGHIWQMYEGALPQISNQKFNDYLQELCRVAGFDEPTIVVEFKGSQRAEKTVPKYELIGAHTGKRSFITNSLLAGMSVQTLCEITGNDPVTIQTYIVPTSEDVEREALSIWSK